MSFGFFTHNIDLGVTGPCTWIPPDPNVPIVAEAIYVETVTSGQGPGGSARDGSFLWGVMGVGNNTILAQTAERRMAVSTNPDATTPTFTVTDNALPTCPRENNPGNWYLRPSVWQYIGNVWYCQMHITIPNSTNQDNTTAYVGHTVDGVNWTVIGNDDIAGGLADGEGNYNSRYCQRSFLWEGSTDSQRLVADGRWVYRLRDNPPGDNNDLAVASYNSWAGGGTRADLAAYTLPMNNGNSTALLSLSDGYFRARWDGTRMRLSWIAPDFSSSYTSFPDITYFNQSEPLIFPGTDTVLLRERDNQDDTLWVWYNGVGNDLPSVVLPNLGPTPANQRIRAAYNGFNWLLMNVQGGATEDGIWYTNYAEDEAIRVSADITAGPQLILPYTQSGAEEGYSNIFHLSGNVWVGYYVRSSDLALVIIRFEYGTFTGDCA